MTRQALGNASLNIVNLISNDAGKLEKIVFASSLVLSTILELVSCIFIFSYLVGWLALVGAVTFLLVAAYIVLVASKLTDLRRKAAAFTDQRLAIVSEVIAGIRAVKMRALEGYFQEKLNKLRM